MQPILVSVGAGPHWTSGPVRAVAPTGPEVYCKVPLNGALHDTKIDCIRLVWEGVKNINFHFRFAKAL